MQTDIEQYNSAASGKHYTLANECRYGASHWECVRYVLVSVCKNEAMRNFADYELLKWPNN